MKINGFSGTNTQTGTMGMTQGNDSVSKNIQNQIANAQQKLQDLSSNEEMSLEDKMKKRQEIQQEINNLNQQLRQHQIEQRKEQQSKNSSSMDDMVAGTSNTSKKKDTGLSQASMQAMISADSSMKQAKVQGSKSVIIDDEYLKQSVVGMIKNLIDDEDCMFYLTADKLNALLRKSDQDKDMLEQQITQYQKQIKLKTKKKAKILDMYLDEQISEEEFTLQRADIDKQIASIQESLNELESLCDYEDVKQNSSKQISKLISEGKAEGFNKELFDLLVSQIVIGGKRSDGVDDPYLCSCEWRYGCKIPSSISRLAIVVVPYPCRYMSYIILTV